MSTLWQQLLWCPWHQSNCCHKVDSYFPKLFLHSLNTGYHNIHHWRILEWHSYLGGWHSLEMQKPWIWPRIINVTDQLVMVIWILLYHQIVYGPIQHFPMKTKQHWIWEMHIDRKYKWWLGYGHVEFIMLSNCLWTCLTDNKTALNLRNVQCIRWWTLPLFTIILKMGDYDPFWHEYNIVKVKPQINCWPWNRLKTI